MNITAEKVVIDTNVFITIFKKDGKNRWIFKKIFKGEWILCVTNEIFLEYWEVLEEKTNGEVASNIIDFLVAHPYVEFVENYIRLNLIPEDPDDNKFCDCCFSSSAKFLISNDKHFKVLTQIEFPSLPLVSSDEVRMLCDDE
ncbi:MAG TPA: putative toxin-antitoxin system toxin component, PIN family [Chitinophagales bacterium]|nr:putative toxin-antitoxin system toxin component, PIN family [Chitinophagales bacterium]